MIVLNPPDGSLCYVLYRGIFSIFNKGMFRIYHLTSFGRLSSCKRKRRVWLITDCAGLVYFSSWLCFNRKYSIGREAHLDSCTHELICTPKLLKSGTGLKASRQEKRKMRPAPRKDVCLIELKNTLLMYFHP